MIRVGADNFAQEVAHNSLPVLVIFSALWCVPCELMKDTFDKVAVEFAGKVKFAQIDIEKDRSVADMFRVGSIPAFFLFNKGVIVNRSVGYMKEKDLIRFITTGLDK